MTAFCDMCGGCGFDRGVRPCLRRNRGQPTRWILEHCCVSWSGASSRLHAQGARRAFVALGLPEPPGEGGTKRQHVDDLRSANNASDDAISPLGVMHRQSNGACAAGMPYHLLAQARAARAPWAVTTMSCQSFSWSWPWGPHWPTYCTPMLPRMQQAAGPWSRPHWHLPSLTRSRQDRARPKL